jgi:hypothetical protein
MMAEYKHSKNMARKLPEYVIGGTLFTVDARIYEFREKEAPWNSISMDDFWEEAPTNILFDKQAKKIYDGGVSAANRPSHVEMITVPPIVELDPIGLARHYNMADDTFLAKVKSQQAGDKLAGLEQNKRSRGKKQQW